MMKVYQILAKGVKRSKNKGGIEALYNQFFVDCKSKCCICSSLVVVIQHIIQSDRAPFFTPNTQKTHRTAVLPCTWRMGAKAAIPRTGSSKTQKTQRVKKKPPVSCRRQETRGC
jgi:hypothetical protein